MKFTYLEQVVETAKHHLPEKIAKAFGDFFDTHCVITWSPEDIIECFNEMCENEEIELEPMTFDEAVEILKAVENKHDCTIGITWEVVNQYVHDFILSKGG